MPTTALYSSHGELSDDIRFIAIGVVVTELWPWKVQRSTTVVSRILDTVHMACRAPQNWFNQHICILCVCFAELW